LSGCILKINPSIKASTEQIRPEPFGSELRTNLLTAEGLSQMSSEYEIN